MKVEDIPKLWPIMVAVVGFIGAASVIPFRLQAAERKIEEIDKKQKIIMEQTTQIGKYIEAIEAEKELRKKAPDGFVWDEKLEKYVPDPRYEPPRKKK